MLVTIDMVRSHSTATTRAETSCIELRASRRRGAGDARRHVARSPSVPTFPTPPGQAGCVPLLAALAFLDGDASAWTVGDLVTWFDACLVAPGLLRCPRIVQESGATPVVIDSRIDMGSTIEDLITRSRARVLAALRGFLGREADDRFLHAAIYSGRVRRIAANGKSTWVASPRGIDFLGDIVLSLLAADILADRAFYAAHLRLCDVCDRVAYKEGPATPGTCTEHRCVASRSTRTVH